MPDDSRTSLRSRLAWVRRLKQRSVRLLNFLAVEKRRHMASGEAFRVGEWTVEPALDRISRGRSRVTLQPQVMNLLVYLASNAGRVVSVEDLLEELWDGRVVTQASIYGTLKQLRGALGDDARDPRYIRTIPKRGYRLIAKVELDQANSARAPDVTFVGAARQQKSAFRWMALTLTLAAAVVLWAVYPRPQVVDTSPARNVVQARPSIAVLPFTDLSPDGSQGWFADGVVEDILNELAQVPELKVTGRVSSFAFREPRADISAIGDALGVNHILEGSIRRDGDQVRVTAQLLKAENGFHVWSNEYDREVGDIFAVQDDIARSIAEALKLQLSPTQLAGDPASWSIYPRFDAYELYLQAREEMKGVTTDSKLSALARLERALELDEGFAEAHVAIAAVYGSLYGSTSFYGDDPVAEMRAKQRPHLEQALKLKPEIPEIYMLQAGMSDDSDEAEQLLRKALELNPNLSQAQMELGVQLANNMSPITEGLAHVIKAFEIEPLSLEAATAAVEFLQYLPARKEEARAIVGHLRANYPDHPRVHYLEGLILLNEGQIADAIPVLEESIVADPDDFRARFMLNSAWFSLGEIDRAMEAAHWQQHWRLVMSPDRDASLNILQEWASSRPLACWSRALSAYTYLMLGEPRMAVESMAEFSLDADGIANQCTAMLAKRYSPAQTLAVAFQILGEADRSALFARVEANALKIRWVNGTVRNEEYSRSLSRLLAVERRDYEALLELEQLVDSGPIDPRELMHPAFAQLRSEPQFQAIADIQRNRINVEREKLSLPPLASLDWLQHEDGEQFAQFRRR